MTKLSYDDGVVRSSVVKVKGVATRGSGADASATTNGGGGRWLEIRRGDLTGTALKEAGQRGWTSKEEWLAAVCSGECQEWAVLGEYVNRFYEIHEETYRGTAPGDGYKERTARAKEEQLREIRYLQGRYNESRSEKARLYWAEMLQNVAQAGYIGSRWHEARCTMWILDRPEIARQIYALSRGGRYTAREGGYKEWTSCGFWFDVLYSSCMGKDFVHDAVVPLPERLDLFAVYDLDQEIAAARSALRALEERRTALTV
jgi:hypothetical protein